MNSFFLINITYLDDLHWLKSLTVWITTNWKILQEMGGVLFLPPSDAYVRSFLYLLYTLIKCYYTKALKKKKKKEMGIPDHLTCLLRNLYGGQEATVRIEHGTTDWFQIGKGVHQGCILSCCLFNLYTGYIMWNAGLDEAQAGIKISGGNINDLRYADDTTLMAESKKELKSLLMKKNTFESVLMRWMKLEPII